MTSFHTTWPDLPEDVQEIVSGFLAQLKKTLGAQIVGVILYGSAASGEYVVGRSNINVLLLLARVDMEVLQRCGQRQRSWSKENIVTPLFFTEEELKTAAALFPLEFLEIKERHVLVEGRNPFPDLHINEQHLAIQCEQEVQSNLLKVRQQFVEGWGRPEAIQALLPISLTALVPCLRGFYRILGKSVHHNSEEVLNQLKAHLDIEPTAFVEVYRMKRGLSSPGIKELPRLFEHYLASLESVVARIHALRGEGRL